MRAARIRKILRKAKGWMLIMTIFVMVFIALHMPFGRLAMTAVPAAVPVELIFPERSREIQILFRFFIVWVQADSRFVMSDRTLVLSKTAKQIGQFLVSDGLGCVQRERVLKADASFFHKLFLSESASQPKFPSAIIGT